MTTPDLSNGPLSGLRVIDLTQVFAGPSCGLLLTYLGAEVIKLESLSHLDSTRGQPIPDDPHPWDHAPLWNEMNAGKKSVQVNLKSPEGVALVKELLKQSDVFFYNMRQNAVDRMGLDYQTLLAEVNPKLVIMCMAGSGSTGPEKDYAGYAPTFAALSGISYVSGWPGKPPFEFTGWPDLEVGVWGGIALVAAILERNRTGVGTFIDLSGNEALTWYTGEHLIEAAMNHRSPGPLGNRHETLVQGCYRCAGDEKFVSIAIATDAEWVALCGAMGQPALASDARFATQSLRLHNQDALDPIIEAWTATLENLAVSEQLQAVDVAGIPTYSGEELYASPHLWERDMFHTVVHPVTGGRTMVAPPWKFSGTPVTSRGAGPLLGEHNAYVFGEILGMAPDEIERLQRDSVLS